LCLFIGKNHKEEKKNSFSVFVAMFIDTEGIRRSLEWHSSPVGKIQKLKKKKIISLTFLIKKIKNS
jgi:hypothetical protein